MGSRKIATLLCQYHCLSCWADVNVFKYEMISQRADFHTYQLIVTPDTAGFFFSFDETIPLLQGTQHKKKIREKEPSRVNRGQ